MAEVLAQFDDVVVSDHGVRYLAQACGAPAANGLWEGWIEFVPIDGGPPVRSPRETTQPNQADAHYWATGLTAVYLDGALRRALNPIVREAAPPARPIFDKPGPEFTTVDAAAPVPHAVLDPFSVYEKGERLLRQELSALSERHLVNIILAYRLSRLPASALNALSSPALVELIAEQIRTRY